MIVSYGTMLSFWLIYLVDVDYDEAKWTVDNFRRVQEVTKLL